VAKKRCKESRRQIYQKLIRRRKKRTLFIGERTSKLGGVEAYTLEYNVLLALRSPECVGGCSGCNYDKYPYTAQVPLTIRGDKYPNITFHSDQDVQDIVDLLIEDIRHTNEAFGKNFNIGEAIFGQLPFFACKRFLYSKEFQEDINRYSYCSTFNVPAYEGHYGSHPKKWVDKSFFIKNMIEKEQVKDGNKGVKQ